MLKKIVLSIFIVFFGFYLSLTPSNDREWQKDVEVLSHAKIDKNLIKIYNIRNFIYKSEFEYTPRYYDEVFDIDKLEGVDLLASYWMGEDIAHIFLSFHFSDNKRIAFSIETRKEVGESYSTFKGFFRQYELYIVSANEDDVVKLRTKIRKNPTEDVYRYQLKGNLKDAKALFIEYAKTLNSLKKEPQFYNTITTNCTTTIYKSDLVDKLRLPFSWKIIASGHIPQYLYEHNMLYDYNLSFEKLQEKAHLK